MLRALSEIRVIRSISVIRGKFLRELRILQSEQNGKEMESRKPETENGKPANLPVSCFRFPVSCFPFSPSCVPAPLG